MGIQPDNRRPVRNRGDHYCRCKCSKCQSGTHCHNLAAGCHAAQW
jgi:hypothetical protein